MTIKSIPYGDRAILIADNYVYICDKILLKSDYKTSDDLMAEIAKTYNEYREDCNGEQRNSSGLTV